MSRHREPNLFRTRTKALIGIPLALLVIGGIAYDPELYTTLVGALTLPVAVGFPILYMTLPWKDSVLGRALMAKARAVALLYIAGVINNIWEYPFHGYLMALIATYLGIAIGFQFIVLVRIKLRANSVSATERSARHDQAVIESA